jgi:hypothetical protein
MRLLLIQAFLLLSLLVAHSFALAAETDTATDNAAAADSTAAAAEDPSLDYDQIQLDSQSSPNEDKSVTREDVEGLKTEIDVLREQWQRKLNKGTVQSTRNLNLSGNFQVRYGASGGGTGSTSTTDGFNVSQVQFGFKGNLYRDYDQGKNLDYAVSLTTDKTSFTILPNDVWLSYNILPSLDPEKPYLKVTAGQQKKPFGLEATTSDDRKPTVVGAQFASAMKLNERDIGILVAGDLFPANDYGFKFRVPLIEYNFMVLNGNGPIGSGNLANADNNLDLLGRIVLNAPVEYSHPLRGLSVGASYYYGKKIVSDKSGAIIEKRAERKRYGADIAYVNTPIGFTYEYARAVDPVAKTVNKKSVLDDVTSDAHTFTLFYNFGEQFVKGYVQQDRYDDWWPLSYQPFFRFDRLTRDTSERNTHTDIYTLGFNWFFAETTKLQLNYNRTFAVVNKSYSNFDDAFIVQFQFGF